MVLNENKTKCLLIGTSQRLSRCQSNLEIAINNHVNVCSDSEKLLGIKIDQCLNFVGHIDYVCRNVTSKISLLSKIKQYLPLDTRKLYYNAYILPVLDYCLTVWGSASKYQLLGAKPIQVVLDIRALSFFGNMIRQKDSIEHQIIRRQLAVKDEDSKSFTITIRKILQKYDLPSAYDLLENTPGKDQWKAMVKKATNDSYRKEISEEIKNKTSLKHLALQENPLG